MQPKKSIEMPNLFICHRVQYTGFKKRFVHRLLMNLPLVCLLFRTSPAGMTDMFVGIKQYFQGFPPRTPVCFLKGRSVCIDAGSLVHSPSKRMGILRWHPLGLNRIFPLLHVHRLRFMSGFF